MHGCTTVTACLHWPCINRHSDDNVKCNGQRCVCAVFSSEWGRTGGRRLFHTVTAQNGLAAAMTLGFDDQETHAGRYEVAILLNAMPPEQLDLGTLHKGRSSRVSPISERETILKDCAEVVQAIKKEIQGDMLVRRVQRGQEEKVSVGVVDIRLTNPGMQILILISPSELWLADTRNKLKFERWLRAGGVGDVRTPVLQ
jgi:hypothetical protein